MKPHQFTLRQLATSVGWFALAMAAISYAMRVDGLALGILTALPALGAAAGAIFQRKLLGASIGAVMVLLVILLSP